MAAAEQGTADAMAAAAEARRRGGEDPTRTAPIELPTAGVIFSHWEEADSLQSEFLATYMATLLVRYGYARCRMLPFRKRDAGKQGKGGLDVNEKKKEGKGEGDGGGEGGKEQKQEQVSNKEEEEEEENQMNEEVLARRPVLPVVPPVDGMIASLLPFGGGPSTMHAQQQRLHKPASLSDDGRQETRTGFGHESDEQQDLDTDICRYAPWSRLSECHLIFVCVERKHVVSCAHALVQTLGKRSTYPVFAVMKSVRATTMFVEEMENLVAKGMRTLRLIPCFTVERNALLRGEPLQLVNTSGGFASERLDKDLAEIGQGPMNLVASMGLPINYQKSLTRFSWGTLVYELFHAIHFVCQDRRDLRSFLLWDWNARLVYAAMLREARHVFKKGASDGKWAPVTNIACPFSLFYLEYAMALPTPLYCLIAWWVSPIAAGLRPAMLRDVEAGKDSLLDYELQEMVSSAEQFSVPANTLRTILHLAKERRSLLQQQQAQRRVHAEPQNIVGGVADLTASTAVLFETVGKPRTTLNTLIVNALTAVMLIVALVVLYELLR